MTNYRATSITGESWVRAYQVIINNRINLIPEITFNEETVVNTGSSLITSPIGHISKKFTDPSTTFDLLNPTDNSVIGSATYQEAYVLLYSLYQALALERDAAAV
jgi:hypothetical protein